MPRFLARRDVVRSVTDRSIPLKVPFRGDEEKREKAGEKKRDREREGERDRERETEREREIVPIINFQIPFD